MAREKATVQIKDINQYLVCSLCGGYYIDATTIMECLHSFCKTCIVRYLETSNYCPKCDVQVHKTRPLLNIRYIKFQPDITLQDLVYKLVPGLLTSEMKRRREFYSDTPPAGENEDKQTAHERKLMTEEDKISIALEFSPDGKHPVLRRPHEPRIKQEDEAKKPENALDCRYLLCPCDFTIAHIKKFIRMKFGLASDLAIDVFHDYEPLGDRYTLLDLAYMFLWKKRAPFKLYYSVYVTGDRARRRKLEQSDKTEEPAQKKQAALPPAPLQPPALPPAPPAAAKPVTPQPPTPPAAPPPTPDAKPASKPPAPAPAPSSSPSFTAPSSSSSSTSPPSTSSSSSSSSVSTSVVPMSSAPRTVINKSPLQMKIVAPTERATSAKTQTPTSQHPLTPAKTPPSNGKPPVTKQASQESQGRPGQAMILPVRLPLSAMMGPTPGPSSPMATNNNNNNNKAPVPKSPITAQHQLPKQVTRDSELKAAHKAHAHKPLATKAPSAVPSSPGYKSPTGQNGQKFPNDFNKSITGQKSPSNGQKSPTTPRPGDLNPGHKNHVDSRSPPKTGLVSPSKADKDRQPPSGSPAAGSSGTLKTVLPLTPNKGHGDGKEQPKTEQKAEPKVPPLRIPISRTDLSRTDLSIHHAPIRRPILHQILPKKPKKKDSNKSKVDLLQARFGRSTNGQTLFMNKVHQTTHRTAPPASASSTQVAPPRPPHLLMPKPAHMNDKPAPVTPPPPHFQNTNHAHNSPPSLNASGAASAGSHSEEQDVPLDLQTPKTVKVS